MSGSGDYTVFGSEDHPVITNYNWGFTDFLTDGEEAGQRSITRGQWRKFRKSIEFDSLSRVYYYKSTGVGRQSKRAIRAGFEGVENTQVPDKDAELAFDITIERPPYKYLLFRDGEDESVLEGVKAIAVIRSYSDIVAIRAPNREYSLAAHELLIEAIDLAVSINTRPEFDDAFKHSFESKYVNRYSELWIQDKTDTAISKRHYYAEESGDLRQSDDIPDYFRSNKYVLIGGYLEMSSEAIESETVPRSDGIGFYFQWVKSRIAFRRKPGDTAILIASDAIIEILAVTSTPPVTQVLAPNDRPLRIEVHEDFRAVVWGAPIRADTFGEVLTGLDVSHEDPVLVQSVEGMEGVVTLRDLANGEFRNLGPPTFARVFTDLGDFTWEQRGEGAVIGLLTAREDLHVLEALLQESADRTLPTADANHIKRLAKTQETNTC